MAEETEQGLAPGTLVGRYRVRGHIADGGMAAVYLAELDGPGDFRKPVALKVIHARLRSNPEFIAMFMEEARVAARLHHPNIVQTYDLLHTPLHLAIAMEYAAGTSLLSLYPQGSLGIDVTPELVAHIGSEVAAGLHHAHTLSDVTGASLGIVHRDISPSNLHIGFDGRIRIVDFGIARARGRLGETAEGVLRGTFAYMAPEQFEEKPVDGRTDVWGLGVVLWELLARQRLFKRPTEADTVYAVLTNVIPDLDEMRADVPEPFVATIRRALERDPDLRWPTAAAFGEALREHVPRKLEPIVEPLREALVPLRDRYAAEMADRMRESGVSMVPMGTERTVAAARDSSRVTKFIRSPRGLAVLGLVVALVGGALLVNWFGRSPAQADRRPAAVEPGDGTAAPEMERISIDVHSAEPGATVLLDGRPLGTSPLHALVPKESGEHVLRVEAEGFVPEERTIPLDAPVALRVDLEAVTDEPSSDRSTRRKRARTSRKRGLLFDERDLR